MSQNLHGWDAIIAWWLHTFLPAFMIFVLVAGIASAIILHWNDSAKRRRAKQQ